jgi:hypothetical protein
VVEFSGDWRYNHFDKFAERLVNLFAEWNSTLFTFSFIIEGASKKVLQFLMMLQPILNKTFASKNKNVYYEHLQLVSRN